MTNLYSLQQKLDDPQQQELSRAAGYGSWLQQVCCAAVLCTPLLLAVHSGTTPCKAHASSSQLLQSLREC